MYFKPPKNRYLKILSDRGFLAANAVAIAGMALLLFFPYERLWDEYILAFGAQGVLPAFFIWFVLRRTLKEYGFGWGKRSALLNGVILVASLAVFLVFSWGLLSLTPIGKDFVATQRDVAGLQSSFSKFLFYVILSLWFTALNEFFFRGFFLFTWKEVLGRSALLAHLVFCTVFVGMKAYGFSLEAFGGAVLLFGTWSFLASLIAFSTESVFLSFCFSFFSDILTTVLIVILS